MLSFIFRRVLAVVPVMAMVAVIVFAILRLTPGTRPQLLRVTRPRPSNSNKSAE